ncbi:hypothetical protein GCM10023231_01350 [Olivibacter ginsenosidimutans]|uniref:Uncharacterized protein n=1 Tax=Olivibacter ginsenosidimutans TaxID=1176537 RepID=A0ABP9ABR6_9SPHI
MDVTDISIRLKYKINYWFSLKEEFDTLTTKRDKTKQRIIKETNKIKEINNKDKSVNIEVIQRYVDLDNLLIDLDNKLNNINKEMYHVFQLVYDVMLRLRIKTIISVVDGKKHKICLGKDFMFTKEPLAPVK